jgi:hypothetical protein
LMPNLLNWDCKNQYIPTKNLPYGRFFVLLKMR